MTKEIWVAVWVDMSERTNQNQQNTDGEWNTTSDIAECVTIRGDAVHSVVRGDIDQHGIIKDVARAVTDSGDYKENHVGNPVSGKGKQQQSNDTDNQKQRKHFFLHSLVVGKRSEKRGKYCQNQDSDRSCQCPDSRSGRSGNVLFCQRTEEDREWWWRSAW